MKDKNNELKKAYYHIMKMEMKRNKYLKPEGYQKANKKLNDQFSREGKIDTDIIFVEGDSLNVSTELFTLRGPEQEALINYFSQFCTE